MLQQGFLKGFIFSLFASAIMWSVLYVAIRIVFF